MIIRHPVDLKRLSLKHVAQWHISLGRKAARQEHEKKEKYFIYWFGVPRYLWKGVIVDSLRLCTNIFNHLTLYNACRSFFVKVGMIREYRRMKKVGKIT